MSSKNNIVISLSRCLLAGVLLLSITSVIAATQPSDAAVRGEADYLSSCAGCHGNPPSANKISKASSAAASRNAISSNIGNMGFLTNTDASLEDIASFIRGDTVTVADTTTSTTTAITPSSTGSIKMTTGYPVLSNNEAISIQIEFVSQETGDLYLAVMYQNQLIFVSNEFATATPTAALTNRTFTAGEVVPLWSYPTDNLPAGNYPFYQVLTQPGSDPLDGSNWIGGLNMLNFAVKLSAASVHDADKNGWYDDDMNKDGFHDDDLDFDGYHDDDTDKDGYHDDDTDKDGLHGVTNGPVAGQKTYISSCARAGCHADDPKRDGTYLLNGRNPNGTRSAVSRNVGGMGYLADVLTDTDYQNIADYLSSL